MKYFTTERKLHATQPNMHNYVLIFREFLQILKNIFETLILRYYEELLLDYINMEQILQSVNLATLLGRFQAQRMMEVDSVLSASDQELVRLGVFRR